MTTFILRHPRWAAALVLVIGALLAFANTLPALHNDDIQQYFTVCNGGVGGTTPFALYCNVVFGYILQGFAAVFPGFNAYLAALLVLVALSLLVINEFVFRHRAMAGEGPWSRVWLWVSVLFLLYINQECLRDQQVQYTHASLVAGSAAALVLYDALCGHAGWKRVCMGVLLFTGMYLLRPEALMAFCFFAAGSVSVWLAVSGFRKPARPCVVMAAAMLACLAVCWGVNAATFAAHADWNDALTYRKLRVNIQDYPDNSGLDKSADLAAAGIDPVELSVFKKFIYVPSMDDMGKIRTARDIHQQGCHGLLGVDGLVKVGLLQPESSKYRDIFRDGVFLTPCIPFAVMLVLALLLWKRGTTARSILPMVLCVTAYVVVLLLAGRFSGRVLYPAVFLGMLWVLAFLPADARLGRIPLVRWGVLGVCLLAYAVSMRHYRPNSFQRTVGPDAAEICASHPENLYFSMSVQRTPLYHSGLFGCSRAYWEGTNVVPIADGWIFYTPAYRAFLQARGISNPYLMAADPNVYFTVKDAVEGTLPKVLQSVDELHFFYTGRNLTFRKVWEDGCISCWKAEEQ